MITEDEFKTAIAVLIHYDVYPSVKNINIQLKSNFTELNGRQLNWRREVALGYGYELHGQNAILERVDIRSMCLYCKQFIFEHKIVDCFTMRLYKACVPYTYYKT